MNESKTHLKELHQLVNEFEKQSGDVVLGKMLPIFGSLIVSLSEEMDKAQQKVVKLTWALFWLTSVLLVIGAVQLFVSMR
jgi:hypothetical protein